MSSSTFQLSFVIPVYNEEKRVDDLAKEIKEFESQSTLSFEVVIADDGSKDDTISAINSHEYFSRLSSAGKLKIAQLEKNQGKGGALKKGVEVAEGDHILTMDADTQMSPLNILNWKKRANAELPDDEIFIGSRPHPDSKLEVEPKRKMMGKVFNLIIRFLTGLPFLDTQNGFKLYPREIGKLLFSQLRNKGWAHDVEILIRAVYMGIPVRDMPVECKIMDDSKVNPIRDSIGMFLQSIKIVFMTTFFWAFIVPIKNFKKQRFGFIETRKYPDYEKFREESIFRMFFLLIFFVLVFVLPIMSTDYGISGDEWIQNEYGKEIYAYFFEGNDRVLYPQNRPQFYDGIIYYSGGFELLCATIYKTLGIENEYMVRHVVNSLFGVLLFFFTGLVALELTRSWKGAVIAVLFIVLTPRVFGHTFNNPKDIPFAAGMTLTLYFLIRFVKELPNPRIRDMIFLSLGIALALNIRIGAFILIAYAGLFSLLRVVELVREKKIDLAKDLRRLIGYGVLIAVIGYVLGIIFWPFALQDPINNPFVALQKMTNFPVTVSVLFEGMQPQSNNLPWYYAIKWMWISNPLVIILGAGLFVLFLWPLMKKFGWLPVFMVLFAAVFPPAYTIYQESVIYDGWRHFIFVWPPIVVLSAAAWHHLIENFGKNKMIRYASVGALVVLLILPARWMIAAHPNQYVYFNELFGGIKNAYAEYETDYYMNTVKQAVNWLAENEGLNTREDTVIILTNCVKEVKQYQKAMGFNARVLYSKYERRIEKPWRYAVFISRFTDHSLLKNNWPQRGLEIHSIKEGGVTLATVLEKPTPEDHLGYKALKNNDPNAALASFENYLKADPYNEQVYSYRGDALSAIGRKEDALKSYNEGLKLHPGSLDILQKMGQIFSEQGKMGQALKAYQRLIRYHPEMFQGYYYAGIASLNMGNAQQGIGYLKRSIEVEPRFKQGYLVLAQIYEQQGNKNLARQYQQMASQLP